MVGWNDGPAPEIMYNGRAVRAICSRTRREDLCSIYGKKASSWGFMGAAITGDFIVEASKISVRLPDGRVVAPADLASPTTAQNNVVLNQFLDEVRVNPGAILEIGSRARSGNTYKSLFPEGSDYVGLDIAAGPNVDVVGDAHHLSRFVESKFRYIFSISVFEHILMPWKAAIEMNSVMLSGGYAYIQSHHGWPLHEEPWDFWRFSSNSWSGLFNKHTGFEIISSGYDLSALIIPEINVGGPMQNLDLQRSHLLSACLIRKIGPPKVEWNAEVNEVYNLGYDHA